jgi:Flp pilus assembly protein TadD
MGGPNQKVAQMKNSPLKQIILSLLCILSLLTIPIAVSAKAVPAEGLKAEGEGNWQEAIVIYTKFLVEEPGRTDLWLRIADIESHLGNYINAAETLKNATVIDEDNALLYFQASKAWAMADQPANALQAVENALYLDPRNSEYQRARGILANWLGDSSKAANSMEFMAAVDPDNKMADLNRARALAIRGDLDNSATAYEKHHSQNSPDRNSLLEHSRVEAWRGNHPGSMELLDRYRKDFGADRDYRQDKARLLAWAARPDSSMAILADLLEEDPADFKARYTKGIALRQDRQPAEALALAEELDHQQPSQDTKELLLAARTPIRSNAGFSLRYYNDSDELGHFHSELFGVYFLSPKTSLGARIEYDRLTAEIGSGLENIDGSESEEHSRAALEISHRFTPWLGADFSLGASQTGEFDEFPTCRLQLDLDPADGLNLQLSRKYGYYLISPRAVSVDVRHSNYLLEVNWRPNLRYTVVGQLSYDDLSDHNSKWAVILAPRRNVLRRQSFKLDLGVRGWLFEFDRDLNNGYYDPAKYESYMATAFAYWQLDRDNGIGLIVAAGILKDDSMDDYEFGWGADLEGTFGIYRDWMLKAYTSIINNQRQAGGAFDAYSAGLTLLRRF